MRAVMVRTTIPISVVLATSTPIVTPVSNTRFSPGSPAGSTPTITARSTAAPIRCAKQKRRGSPAAPTRPAAMTRTAAVRVSPGLPGASW